MIGSPFLRDRDRYERRIEGRTDNSHDDAFTHTVRVTDVDRSVEVSIVARPSPTYEIRAARCDALAGEVAPSVIAGFADLAGVAMVAGFTRRVAEATGSGAAGATAVEAAIEVARLARQVTKLPPERVRRADGGDPFEFWQLDTSGWVDLPDSCFTYSDAGRALFGTRRVSTPMQPHLYCAAPGQQRLFERRKVARMERTGDRLALFHSMDDNVHAFELTYEVDLSTGRIARAESVTPRLPYMGICSEPQARIGALVGERVDVGLRKRISSILGGTSGCAQLYDLTSDLLKLLTLPA